MSAAVCAGPGAPLEVRRIPVPQPIAGEYLVKLETCGVCHSDLHLRNGDEALPDSAYPLILGHEGIGRIIAGEGPLEIGTRVGLPWIYDTCLSCRPCLTGSETFCPDQRVRGVCKTGAFAEYALLDNRFACPIPEIIDPVQGAPLLCAGLTAWSALNKTRTRPGSRVLVIGAGGLGQYAIMIARAFGADVTAVDRDSEKLGLAINAGAKQVLTADENTGESIRAAGGADVVLNFAPSPAIWSIVESAVNPMADIVAVALVYQPVPLSTMWLIDGGHRLFGSSVGSRAELRDFLVFASTRNLSVPVESLPLARVNDALDRLAAGRVKGRLCIDFGL